MALPPDWQFTPEELADIRAAYLTGARLVKIADRTIEFRSLSEMEQIITTGSNFIGTRGLHFQTCKGL